MTLRNAAETVTALQLVGEILEAQRAQLSLVVIGGAALNLLGVVDRATRDVDVLAFSVSGEGRTRLVPPPEPLPTPLTEAVAAVARDLNLAPDWLNTGPALQWRQGLPPRLEERVTWRSYGGLRVGIVGRFDLICFKLYACADQTGPESRHVRDLLALSPSRDELLMAADWVRGQDPSPAFAEVLSKVIGHVLSQTR
ncbi:MAG: DUF6036 family nucleotidyltransferase [Gemmatimonadales bacterium]